MKNLKSILLLILALSFVACMGKSKSEELGNEEEKYTIKDKIKFYKALGEDELLKDSELGIISYLKIEYSNTRKITKEEFQKLGLELLSKSSLNGKNFYFLQSKEGKMFESMKALEGLEGTLSVEAQPRLYSTGDLEINREELRSVKPNDVRIDEMNSVKITQLDKAWEEFGFGSTEPYVGVLDSGVNFEHEDLRDTRVDVAKSRWEKFDMGATLTGFKAAGTDDEGNPIFVNMLSTEYKDQNSKYNWDVNSGHGTHTTGTILARGNNGLGVAGVNWKSRLMMYKVFADNPEETDAEYPSGNPIYDSLKDLIDEVKKLRSQGLLTQTTIPVNFSIGGNYATSYALEVINYGIENGVLLVTSAGNSGRYFDATFPSSFSGVLTVGAGSVYGDATGFSTATSNISVIAPGNAILSTSNHADDEYVNMSGTSMSAPFVTGVVSYMLTFDPNLSASEIKSILEQTADPVDNLWETTPNQDDKWKDRKWSPKNGYGRVNVYNAIKAVKNRDEGIKIEYSSRPLKVKVTSKNKIYDDMKLEYPLYFNVEVYLYQLNKHGKKEFVTAGITNKEGIVEFYMLKSGKYLVETTVGSKLISKEIMVEKDKELNIELDSNKIMWNAEIIDLNTEAKDAVVSKHYMYILDEKKEKILLATANKGNNLGQIEFKKSGVYYVLLGCFSGDAYENSGGNYGISVYVNGNRPEITVPSLNPDNTIGRDTNFSGTSGKLPLNTVQFGTFDENEYGNIGNWDIYEITIPEEYVSK